MSVYMIRPIMISANRGSSIIKLQFCNVSFSKSITFKSNNCKHLIDLQTFIKLREHTNITLIKNRCSHKLININFENDFILCAFFNL